MANNSNIEWTDTTWNPVTGCTKISPGCKNCYAEKMTLRLQAMGQPNYVDGFKVKLQPQMLTNPLHWKKPRRIFVNSMSDLFHKDVPDDYIDQVFAITRRAQQHTYQILTKRPEQMLRYFNAPFNVFGEMPCSNIWLGTSIENRETKWRIDYLRRCPLSVKFLSIEPLLEDLGEINLNQISWVIVGGESGPNARPMEADWVRSIRDQCFAQGVKFFFKQGSQANWPKYKSFDDFFSLFCKIIEIFQ